MFDFLRSTTRGRSLVAAALLIRNHTDTEQELGLGRDFLPVAAGLAAFLGHLFPVYLRFRGGKGVATGFGVVTVLMPGPALVAALVWVTVLAATRYVSLASICAGPLKLTPWGAGAIRPLNRTCAKPGARNSSASMSQPSLPSAMSPRTFCSVPAASVMASMPMPSRTGKEGR